MIPGMIQEAADLLFAAATDSKPIGQLTQRCPAMSVADAYRI
jgi:2-keto-4-pentenoate hydratase